jgi:hypothetical protein
VRNVVVIDVGVVIGVDVVVITGTIVGSPRFHCVGSITGHRHRGILVPVGMRGSVQSAQPATRRTRMVATQGIRRRRGSLVVS